MPLPVAEKGIAGLLQRSENRRNSVSPNDSPGTAKRIVEGSLHRGFPRPQVDSLLLSLFLASRIITLPYSWLPSLRGAGTAVPEGSGNDRGALLTEA